MYGQCCIASPFRVRECNEAPYNYRPVQFGFLEQIEITLWVHAIWKMKENPMNVVTPAHHNDQEYEGNVAQACGVNIIVE